MLLLWINLDEALLLALGKSIIIPTLFNAGSSL